MPEEHYYVSIHNLPKDIEKQDIISFVPDTVKILNANINFVNDGSQTRAVLRLSSKDDQRAVLSKNERFFQNSQLRIYESSKEEFEGRVEPAPQPKPQPKIVFPDRAKVMVKLRGLPFDASPDEIYTFFKNF